MFNSRCLFLFLATLFFLHFVYIKLRVTHFILLCDMDLFMFSCFIGQTTRESNLRKTLWKI